jgi:hypothetical protein
MRDCATALTANFLIPNDAGDEKGLRTWHYGFDGSVESFPRGSARSIPCFEGVAGF